MNQLKSPEKSSLMRWIRKKYKRFRSFKAAHRCWQRITSRHPRLFAHWAWTPCFW
ncbi:hypothetical protein [Streptomyces sp. NPDC020298]|uniref:hypothetical protein n=1 Tax=unclassified Streptomyces TaxID=2593676 RepID=UPI0033E26234